MPLKKILATHNADFHADDVLSTAMLKIIFKDEVIIKRTRNENILARADFVYDVGGIYNEENNQYDHHQRSFNETFSPKYNIRLSSAGLIYKHHHRELFQMYGVHKKNSYFDALVTYVYENYIMGIDADDNGYEEIYGNIYLRNMPAIIKSFRKTRPEIDDAFLDAVEFMQMDLHNYLCETVEQFENHYASFIGEIRNCTEEYLYTKEKCSPFFITYLVNQYNDKINFLISDGGSQYRVYCLNKKLHSFKGKKLLKSEWRGLRECELREKSGLSDINFVHYSGFTGGADSMETILEMIKVSELN